MVVAVGMPSPRIHAVQVHYEYNDPAIRDAIAYVVRICDPRVCGGTNFAELCIIATETNSLKVFGRMPKQCGEILPGRRSVRVWKRLLEQVAEQEDGAETELAKALVQWLDGGRDPMVLGAADRAWFAYRRRWEQKRVEILDQKLYQWGESLTFDCETPGVPLDVIIEELNREIERWTGRKAVVKYRSAGAPIKVGPAALRRASLSGLFRWLVLNEEAAKAGLRIRYVDGEVMVWHELNGGDCCELYPEGSEAPPWRMGDK